MINKYILIICLCSLAFPAYANNDFCSKIKKQFSQDSTSAWEDNISLIKNVISSTNNEDKKKLLEKQAKELEAVTDNKKKEEELTILYKDIYEMCDKDVSEIVMNKIYKEYPRFGEMKDGYLGFVYPPDFVDTPVNREKVIKYIEMIVKEQYCGNSMLKGMCNPSNLRMMEKENLNSFRYLTKATNIPALQQAISNYCNINLCDYNTIKMMYDEYNQASGEKLYW